MRSGWRGSLVLLTAAGVVTAAMTSAPATSSPAPAATTRATGTLLVSPSEEGGEPAYAVALADDGVVPVDGDDLGGSPEPGDRVTFETAQGRTATVRSITPAEPAAEPVAPAVHRVYVAAPTNLGTFPMTDAAMLNQLRQAAAYWVDESDGAILEMRIPSTVLRYTASVATDANDCGLSSDFFEVMDEAAGLFPTADFFGGPDHLVLLGPSQCLSGSAAGRAMLGRSLADGGVQVTYMGGPQAVGTLAHEWGHNLGLMHSNVGTCDDDFSCSGEYENIYNVMGFGTDPSHNRLTALSTAFRSILGIHASGEVQAFPVGDGAEPVSVTRRLVPRSSETGLRSVSVLDPDTGHRLFIEYRSGTLQDAGSSYALGYTLRGRRFEPGVVVEHVDVQATSLIAHDDTASPANSTWSNDSGTLTIAAGPLSESGVAVTVTYAPAEPWPTELTVAVDGDPTVNRWVSAQTNAGGRLYQWLIDGEPVPGAEDWQLRLQPEHAGKQVAVAVTEYEYGRGMRTVVSDAVEVRPGTLHAYAGPTISGTAEVGRTLTTRGGIWDDPDFDGPTATALQWRRDGTPIAGATAPSYVVGAEDAGHRITVSDTGSREGYTPLTLTSAPTALVPLPVLPDGPTPTIEGLAQVDSTLTVEPGTWPDGTTLTFRWRANGTDIPGADGSTYVPGAADVGRRISVRVTGTKPGYQPATRTSTATAAVAKAPLVAGDPTITGRARVGRTLQAVTGTWTDGTTFRYRWKANGVNIRGATAPTLVLKARQRGKRITVVVTGTRSGYTTESRTSPPTRRVRR